jgi:hypothetical protein
MISSDLRSLASVSVRPVGLAVSAALAMFFSLYWVVNTDLLTLIAAIVWIVVTAVLIRASIEEQVHIQ